MKRNIFLLALLTLICATSACKRLPIDPNDDHKDSMNIRPHILVSTSWQLFGHQDNRSMAPAPIPVNDKITLSFNTATEAYGGTGFNKYTVNWKADDKNIGFYNLFSTKVAVSGDSYEGDYFRIVSGALTYQLLDNGETLIISDSKESLYFHAPNSTPQDFKSIVQLTDFRVVRFQVDPFNLQTVRKIDETHIAINVQYSGGCAEHDFNVFADKNIQMHEEGDIAEIMITHDSHQDMCEAMATKELIIDVSPLLKHWRENSKSDRLVLNFSQAPYLSTIVEFKR